MATALEEFQPSDAMRAEVVAWMEQREPEPDHVTQVCRLALSLFDQLRARHGDGDGPRFLLEAAALLHDIGWSDAPDGRKHHKLAYQMIRAHPWQSLPPEAVRAIALIARYHRKSVPDPRHEGFGELEPGEKRVVRRLAALLRVADALDRSHQSHVNGIIVEDRGATVALRLQAPHPCDAERATAESKKDLFEEVFRASLALSVDGRRNDP